MKQLFAALSCSALDDQGSDRWLPINRAKHMFSQSFCDTSLVSRLGDATFPFTSYSDGDKYCSLMMILSNDGGLSFGCVLPGT